MAGRAPLRVTWRGRMWRGLWPDHNPLRRACDRAEAAIAAALLATFVIAAPLLGVTAGQDAYHAILRAEHAQASRYAVPAVLLTDAPPATVSWILMPHLAWARWTAPDGNQYTGEVPAPPNAQAGSTVTVWVTASGRRTEPPPGHSQVVNRAIFTAAGVITALALVLLGAAMLAHCILDRRRLAAWDAEWRVTGPRWTSRH